MLVKWAPGVTPVYKQWGYIDDLVQHCGISIALAMEIPLSGTKSLTYFCTDASNEKYKPYLTWECLRPGMW